MTIRDSICVATIVVAAGGRAAAQTAPDTEPARPAIAPPAVPRFVIGPHPFYDQAREAIEQGKFDIAIQNLNRVIQMKTRLTDAAMYWKAYSLAKVGQRFDALAAIDDLGKEFGASRWLKDAKALEVELRQASGEPMPLEAQPDDELKLLALRGMMQRDPDNTLSTLEQMLAGPNTVRVKDRALFVVSQSRAPRARDIIVRVAKEGPSPELQLNAVRYLGIMDGPETGEVLGEVYRTSADTAIRRAVVRSYGRTKDRERLLAVAKSDPSTALRSEAVQQLGAIGAQAEINELYQAEPSTAVKVQIVRALAANGNVERLSALVNHEKNPELRASTRRTIVHALALQNNPKALADLGRAEQDPQLKKEIIAALAAMHSKEAGDYLTELLK